MIFHLLRISIFTAALLGVQSSRATGQVFDLTGAWAGKLTCKAANAGAKETSVATPVLAVTQSGNVVGLRLDFGGGVIAHYTGLANPDGKKPLAKGELGLIRCGTDSLPGGVGPTDEVGRLFAATKAPPAIKATLKGTSVFSEDQRVGTCSWKWTRTALTDPGVETSCPE